MVCLITIILNFMSFYCLQTSTKFIKVRILISLKKSLANKMVSKKIGIWWKVIHCGAESCSFKDGINKSQRKLHCGRSLTISWFLRTNADFIVSSGCACTSIQIFFGLSSLSLIYRGDFRFARGGSLLCNFSCPRELPTRDSGGLLSWVCRNWCW